MSNAKRAIPLMSAEASLIYGRLSKCAPGELTTYSDLREACGANVQRHRGALATARAKAQRDDGMVFVTIANVGIRRAMGLDFVGIGRAAVNRTRKAAKRAMSKSMLLPKNEYDAFDNEAKVAINVDRTMLGTVTHFLRGKPAKEIEGKVRLQNDRLAIGQIIEMEKARNG